MKSVQVVGAIAALALLGSLTACGGGAASPTPAATKPSSKPTSTATATTSPLPTPTATAAPAAEPAAWFLVLPDFLGVYTADDGSIANYDSQVPIATMAADLTTYFGFAPSVSRVEADPSGDGQSYTRYDWEGFELQDWDLPASRDPFIPEYFIMSSVAEVRGVSIETTDGARVGDSVEALAAAHPGNVERYSGEFGPETAIRIFPMDPRNGRYGPIRIAVRLSGPDGGVIQTMFSPSPDLQM